METDYFNLNRHLTNNERSVRNSVMRFVQNSLFCKSEDSKLTCIADSWQKGVLPKKFITGMADLGLFGLLLSINMKLDGRNDKEIEKYGGFPGFSSHSYGLVMQELERGDSGLRSFASVQCGLVMHAIYAFGSEEQKLRWLPKLASGEIIGCFGATEPGGGSNVIGYKATAKKDGNYYILDGIKEWITNATLADISIVWAKTEDGVMRGFIVEKNMPGFEAKKIEYKNSMRASDTGSLLLNDCRVLKENILPVFDAKTKGIKSVLQCFNQARFGICCGVIGAAQVCFDEARNFVLTRGAQGGPLASKQLIHEKLAVMAAEIGDMQLRAREIIRLKDEKKLSHTHVSMVKWRNCASALRVAMAADEVLASMSITDELSISRHLNNLRSVRTYEGSEEMQKLIAGKRILGVSAV